MRGGYANGYGAARWFEYGTEYKTDKGGFREGKLNGHAVVTAGPEIRFEGEFRNNRPNGYGVPSTTT